MRDQVTRDESDHSRAIVALHAALDVLTLGPADDLPISDHELVARAGALLTGICRMQKDPVRALEIAAFAVNERLQAERSR